MRNHLNTVKTILADQLGIDESDISPDSEIIQDLGADSLDTIELVMAFEEEYDIEVPDEEAEKLQKVSDIVLYLEKHSPSEES